jgi:hypothetical protein
MVANRYCPEHPSPNIETATASGGSAARVVASPASHTSQTDKFIVIEISDSEELEELRN